MMSYAIDLNPRQSARTLEQAIRQRAQTVLEPRAWADHQQLICRLEPAGGSTLESDVMPMLGVSVLSRGEAGAGPADDGSAGQPVALDELQALVGTYVDGYLLLGEQRYMFSSDIQRVLPAGTDGTDGTWPRLHLTRPAVLQVAQRRRFRRIVLSHSAQVELSWIHGEQKLGGVAWLCNVSGDGIACRTEERIAESLWIGDELEIDFSLTPTDTERFCLKGVLCNKTPSGTLGKSLLGIQFSADANQAETAEKIRLLRKRLIDRRHQLADLQRGVE